MNGMRVSARAVASSGRLVAKLLAAFAAALLAKQGTVLDVPSGRDAMRDAWRDAEVREARIASSLLMSCAPLLFCFALVLPSPLFCPRRASVHLSPTISRILQQHQVASNVRITGKGELWTRWMEAPSKPVDSGVRISGRGALVPAAL